VHFIEKKLLSIDASRRSLVGKASAGDATGGGGVGHELLSLLLVGAGVALLAALVAAIGGSLEVFLDGNGSLDGEGTGTDFGLVGGLVASSAAVSAGDLVSDGEDVGDLGVSNVGADVGATGVGGGHGAAGCLGGKGAVAVEVLTSGASGLIRSGDKTVVTTSGEFATEVATTSGDDTVVATEVTTTNSEGVQVSTEATISKLEGLVAASINTVSSSEDLVGTGSDSAGGEVSTDSLIELVEEVGGLLGRDTGEGVQTTLLTSARALSGRCASGNELGSVLVLGELGSVHSGEEGEGSGEFHVFVVVK